jgi:nucleotide-binding universal stress UspA family protein
MLIRRIFHPSDFSDASNVAFAHALRLAIAGSCELTILHTGSVRSGDAWMEFPRVRGTLEQWKMLPPNSPKAAIATLGLTVEKVALPYSDPLHSMRHFLSLHPHDLMVLATHQHDGYERWAHPQVAEPLARKAAELTLFVPHGTPGFVSSTTGDVRLSSILLPIDHQVDAGAAIKSAATLAETLGCGEAEATLLHVGDAASSPQIRLPGIGALKWRSMRRSGNVEEEILKAAEEYHADLIVMATQGHRGFLDALRGSTTERIVRHAACPVLAVPAHEVEPELAIIEDLAMGSLAI